jgi:hypothetical protein
MLPSRKLNYASQLDYSWNDLKLKAEAALTCASEDSEKIEGYAPLVNAILGHLLARFLQLNRGLSLLNCKKWTKWDK